MQYPRITYYTKIIDNKNGKVLMESSYSNSRTPLYYGKCSNISHSESEYVIEIAIWNNESAFDANMTRSNVLDAYNCNISVYPNKFGESDNRKDSFFYIRCISDNIENEYEPIWCDTKFDKLVSKINRNNNILLNGDCFIVQTKIILPENEILDPTRHKFKLYFSYDCDMYNKEQKATDKQTIIMSI